MRVETRRAAAARFSARSCTNCRIPSIGDNRVERPKLRSWTWTVSDRSRVGQPASSTILANGRHCCFNQASHFTSCPIRHDQHGRFLNNLAVVIACLAPPRARQLRPDDRSGLPLSRPSRNEPRLGQNQPLILSSAFTPANRLPPHGAFSVPISSTSLHCLAILPVYKRRRQAIRASSIPNSGLEPPSR